MINESIKEQQQVLMEISGSLQDARKLVEDMGWIWRGIAGYTPRLCPLVAVANPQYVDAAEWLKVKHGAGELVHA